MTSNHWQPTKLGELLKREKRQEQLEPLKSYRLLGVRLDSNGAFQKGVKEGKDISAKYLYRVEEGDFIYSRLFAWRGAFGIIDTKLAGAYVSGEFPTFIHDKRKLDLNFLNYWFRIPDILRQVEADCSGSTPLTRNRYKEKFLLSLKIPLPPLAEQRRIVARIEALAGKVEEARRLRETAVAQANKLIASLHISLSSNRKTKMSELVELHEDREDVESGKKYPQVGIKGFGGGLFSKAFLTANDTSYKWFNRLYEEAVVLSQPKGWEGAIAVCGSELDGWYVSPEYRTFRCIPSMANPQYLAKILTNPWFWKQLEDVHRGLGGRRQRTRPEQFLNLEIVMPTIGNQKKALDILNKLDVLQPLQTQTVRELDALLPAILDKAFKGEL
jgi:type I restriction enzyme S subunit